MSLLYPGRGAKALLPALLVLVLFACSTLTGERSEPAQSPNDTNQYRFLTLDNSLDVLLISDPETKKAAASLDVMVGSGDNPPDREGLAHFLEHMLFLGTDKYPDAAEYEEFITEHGGSRNAYTSPDNTNYHFDINEAYLPDALDRFAQFFIAPRFDAQYVEREKNAVEAEYQMGLKSDGRRGYDVLQEVMNPEHPYSQFSVGSLETLADREDSAVRDDLLAFYEKYYSANQMKLVVLGSGSLDELEALVRPMFSPIPNKSFEHETIAAPMFVDSSLPMLVEIEPLATKRELQVSFPIADYRAQYAAKPLSYLGNLVGHEGGGSLLSQLKAEGLAEGLSAGGGVAWRGGGLFSVGVVLTEEGVQNYDRVLELMFSYLSMLREQGPQQWLYKEQAQLAELSFRFKADPDPQSYVVGTARGMHYYSAADVLSGPYEMSQYDEQMLVDLLAVLVPEHAQITLTDKSVETDRVSDYYQVPYRVTKVDAEKLLAWQSGKSAEVFTLPQVNEFIAEDVALVKITAGNPANPAVALEQTRQKVWFKQDEQFRVPRGATYINFRSTAVGQSAEQTAAAVLYTALLTDAVNEYTYPALLAGMHFNLYKHAQGISLRIDGYNDKQDVLLDHLLDTISAPNFEQQRFINIRDNMIRGLQNIVAMRPSSQVMADMREALLYGEWGESALIAALEQMTLESVDAYAGRFWDGASAEVMIYGNYDPAAVEQVSELVMQVLPAGPAPEVPGLKVLKIAPGEQLQYVVDIPHDDSVVAWYLQGAGDGWDDRAATVLAAQIMKSGFFQQLRTEQQLGYVVSAFAWPQLEVPGLVMLIQSPTASSKDVAQAMATFLGSVEASLSEEQFARHKQALISDILRPHKNIGARASFYWQSIASKQYDFDGRDALATAVEGFTLESWSNYFRQTFIAQPHALQVVTPGRLEALPTGDFERYQDADSIKRGHEVYEIH
ncbi:MAG: insulinase family protein [Halioglobus sp.]